MLNASDALFYAGPVETGPWATAGSGSDPMVVLVAPPEHIHVTHGWLAPRCHEFAIVSYANFYVVHNRRWAEVVQGLARRGLNPVRMRNDQSDRTVWVIQRIGEDTARPAQGDDWVGDVEHAADHDTPPPPATGEGN